MSACWYRWAWLFDWRWTLITDHYGGLSSKESEAYLKQKNITHIFTAVDSPFSNGANERLNQILVNGIRCRINENKNRLTSTTIAQKCTEEYNDTIHSITSFTRNSLMNGIEPNLNFNRVESQSEILKTIKNIA